MMANVQIFVEGVADCKFLQDVIWEWYGVKLEIGGFKEGKLQKFGSILGTGGKDFMSDTQKLDDIQPILQDLAIREIPVIIILDTDTLDDKVVLTEKCKELKFTPFFMSGSTTETGDLETLLEEIICSDNQVVFDCWQDFESCLSKHETKSTVSGKFTLLSRKTKIHNYVEVLVGESKNQKKRAKEENRDYRNPKHWNLAHPALSNLRAFLDPYFP